MQSSISLKPRKEKGLQRFFNQAKNLPLIVYYLASTFSISFLGEIIVGYTIIYTLGYDAFKTPVITTLYTALAYILAFVILALLPSLILKNHDPKKKLNPIQKLIYGKLIKKPSASSISPHLSISYSVFFLSFFTSSSPA